MTWWLGSVFGDTAESREAAMAKLPAELVALMKDRGLDKSISSEGKAMLPPELMKMVHENFNADGDALPMGLEEAKEHRLKLMEVRSGFVQTAEAGWQQHSYSFCEH